MRLTVVFLLTALFEAAAAAGTANVSSELSIDELVSKAHETFANFTRDFNLGDKGYNNGVQGVRLAFQAAFVKDDEGGNENAALVSEEAAAALWHTHAAAAEMDFAGATLEQAKKMAVIQRSLLKMLAKLCDLAIAKQANPELGQKWLLKLMRLAFKTHSAVWRQHKATLREAGLLPEGYTTPDNEAPEHGEL